MITQPLQIVHIKGEGRELLYSLSLYKILQDRNQQVIIKKGATWYDVTAALLRMIYAAYINAIQVRQVDEPAYNPEPLKYMDFVEWSTTDVKEFSEQIKICYEHITGKPLALEVDEKKKRIFPKPQKIRIWRRILESCRRLLSGISGARKPRATKQR